MWVCVALMVWGSRRLGDAHCVACCCCPSAAVCTTLLANRHACTQPLWAGKCGVSTRAPMCRLPLEASFERRGVAHAKRVCVLTSGLQPAHISHHRSVCVCVCVRGQGVRLDTAVVTGRQGVRVCGSGSAGLCIRPLGIHTHPTAEACGAQAGYLWKQRPVLLSDAFLFGGRLACMHAPYSS